MVTVVYSFTRGEPQRNFVQPITSSSGLYYDYLGNLKINNVQLQVIIPVDISHFKPHIENIETTLETLKHLCKQTRIEQIALECHNLLQPITARFQDMSKEFSAISHLLDNRSKRSAWIGVIGTAMKHIFGSLDENDGMRYDEAITSLQNDEKRLATLMRENILVTSSTLRLYNDSLIKIRENESNLNVAIDKLSLSVKNISEFTNGLQILMNVNEVFNAIETAIITLSFQLEDITNAIMFSSQNILHPSIMTPKQLYQELVDNYRHLSNDLELPVALNINSIHLILSISKIVCFYIKDKIVFVLQVPLVNTKEYVLFHNVAVPTPHKPKEPNTFTLIIPDNKYIAMTIDKSHYCTFNDLGACKSVSPGNFICDLESVYSTDAKPICESELLAKVISEKPTQCETKVLYGNLNIWKSLTNNNWLYVQSEPQKVSVDCTNTKLYETNILGTGILNIPKDCIGYCNSATFIPTHNVLQIASPINHVPDFNLINDTCCNLDKVNAEISNVSPIRLHNIDLDEFHSGNKLKSILSNLHEIESRKQPHIVEYGTQYSIFINVILSFIIIFILYLAIKICCNKLNNRPFQYFNKKQSVTFTTPETVEMTDRPDIDIEIINPVAPLRTRI